MNRFLKSIKHYLRVLKLSKKYCGSYLRYWDHDISKLWFNDEKHEQYSHHHPKRYEYFPESWFRNNWEEICLNWEAEGSAQDKMLSEYPWAYVFVMTVLDEWGIWDCTKNHPSLNKEEKFFYEHYMKHHPYNHKTYDYRR